MLDRSLQSLYMYDENKGKNLACCQLVNVRTTPAKSDGT
jgi:hypothetical protein